MCNLPVRYWRKRSDTTLVSLQITNLVVFALGAGLWLGKNCPNLVLSCYIFWGAGLFLVLLSFWEPSSIVLGIIGFVCLAGGILFGHSSVLRDMLIGFASGAFSGLCMQEKHCD